MKLSDAKILRVYGNMIEQEEFPLPWLPLSSKRTSYHVDKENILEHNDVALHHKIRWGNYGVEIRQLDRLFQTSPGKVTSMHINTYTSLIQNAKVEELAMADIILCTCSVAGGPLFSEIKINQVTICNSQAK